MSVGALATEVEAASFELIAKMASLGWFREMEQFEEEIRMSYLEEAIASAWDMANHHK